MNLTPSNIAVGVFIASYQGNAKDVLRERLLVAIENHTTDLLPNTQKSSESLATFQRASGYGAESVLIPRDSVIRMVICVRRIDPDELPRADSINNSIKANDAGIQIDPHLTAPHENNKFGYDRDEGMPIDELGLSWGAQRSGHENAIKPDHEGPRKSDSRTQWQHPLARQEPYEWSPVQSAYQALLLNEQRQRGRSILIITFTSRSQTQSTAYYMCSEFATLRRTPLGVFYFGDILLELILEHRALLQHKLNQDAAKTIKQVANSYLQDIETIVIPQEAFHYIMSLAAQCWGRYKQQWQAAQRAKTEGASLSQADSAVPDKADSVIQDTVETPVER